MKKSELKQLIKEIVNEVQWDLQTPEGRARYQAGVDKRIGAQLDTLQKQIGDDERKKKAQPILNKKPFKKPFEETTNLPVNPSAIVLIKGDRVLKTATNVSDKLFITATTNPDTFERWAKNKPFKYSATEIKRDPMYQSQA